MNASQQVKIEGVEEFVEESILEFIWSLFIHHISFSLHLSTDSRVKAQTRGKKDKAVKEL